MKDLIIIGAGGYAKSVLDSLDHMNFSMVGYMGHKTKRIEWVGVKSGENL